MVNPAVPKVSICIPIYNSAKFLGAAVESALAQVFDSFEVLIIDDCSSDESATIASQYAAQSPLIRFVSNKKNIGMVANWNLCLKLAKGEYIKFLFSDDLFATTCNIHRLATVLDQHPEVALACSYRSIIDSQGTIQAEKGFEPSGQVVAGSRAAEKCLSAGVNYIGEPSVVMFRKDEAARGFVDSYRQLVDLEMWLHLLQHGGIWCEQEALAAFRRHPDQQTTGNVKARIHLDELLCLYDTYFKHDLISHSKAYKMVLYYVQCYQVWKCYAKDRIMTREQAEKIIGRYFSPLIFKSMIPLYKFLNPLRKVLLRLREKRDLKKRRETRIKAVGCTL